MNTSEHDAPIQCQFGQKQNTSNKGVAFSRRFCNGPNYGDLAFWR